MTEQWKDRFIKREMIPAAVLAQRFNIYNFRRHPESQQRATRASLEKLGWLDEVSLSTNGDGPASLDDNPKAVMWDGHLRVKLALLEGDDTPVPCKWYQLSPDETNQALLLKDQTSAIAEIDWEIFGEFMQVTPPLEIPELDEFLRGLMEETGANFDPDSVEFKEYDESVENDVEYITCPKCGERWPK